MRAAIALVPLVAALFGCPTPPTAMARAQVAAQEFNVDSRFGRSELALDRVAGSARDEFAMQHRGWGTSVRIAEVEVSGLRPRGERDADVIVRVAWYRPNEQELRTTTLKQNWCDQGGWKLVGEQRLDGDIGLLGEPIVYERPPDAPAPQFKTVRLGQ
jgi:hypothetical protein